MGPQLKERLIRSHSEGRQARVGNNCVETLSDFQWRDIAATTALLRGFTARQIIRSEQFGETFGEFPPRFDATETPEWAPRSVTRGVAEWGHMRVGLGYPSVMVIKREIDRIVNEGRQLQNAQ